MACASAVTTNGPQKYSESANILRARSRNCLQQLDVPSYGNVANGYPTDYSGLGELMDFSVSDVNLICEQHREKTLEIFAQWARRRGSTIQKLFDYLETLECYSILEGPFRKYVDEDIEHYYNTILPQRNEDENVVSSTTGTYHVTSRGQSEHSRITLADAAQEAPMMYDALVIVNEQSDTDLQFADELIEHCEVQNGLALCLLYRDQVPGCDSDDALACLIEQRCRHVIVVLSPALIQNESCQQQLKMATAAKRLAKNRIIPVLLEPCEIPLSVRFLANVNYTTKATRRFFWPKVLASLRCTSVDEHAFVH